MKSNNEKQTIEKMRRFLIWRFIVIVLIVAMVELLIMELLDRQLFPILQWYFLKNVSNNSISGEQILYVVVIYLAEYLLRMIGIFLSPEGKNTINTLILWVENYVNSKIPALSGNLSITQMGNLESLAFLGILIAALIVILLPPVVGAVCYAWFATREIRKLEKERDAAKREHDRRRNLMLSDIAHDLRTPITTISGYAKALADGVVTDEGKKQEYLQAMQVKSARMNELIQLLFDYVKLDSEGFRLNRETFDICELLRQNAALVYSDIEEAGMELDIDIPDDVCLIYADKLQMSRVITNLLNNAIKHNETGIRILLSLKIEDGKVYITVADTGNVISPEIATHIFDPFVMGDDSRSSRGGNGLGLSIAHKIIEMHGWKLGLEQKIPSFTKAFVMIIS